MSSYLLQTDLPVVQIGIARFLFDEVIPDNTLWIDGIQVGRGDELLGYFSFLPPMREAAIKTAMRFQNGFDFFPIAFEHSA